MGAASKQRVSVTATVDADHEGESSASRRFDPG